MAHGSGRPPEDYEGLARVRAEGGIAVSAGESGSTFADMAALVRTAKVDYVLGVIDATIAQYRDAPPDAARLAALQKRLKYGFLMGLQTPDAVAQRVAQFLAVSGDLSGIDSLYATYAAITPADVQAAAKAYLVPERRTVGVLRPRP